MRGRRGKRQAWLLRLWQAGAMLLLLVALLIWFVLGGPRQTTPPQLVTEPDQQVAPLVNFINGAHTSLDGEIYILTSPYVLEALESAPARGIRVRLLLERYPGSGPSPKETFARLQEHGVQVRWAPRRFRFTHAKWLLRDRQTAWIGTMNWSAVAFKENRGFALVLTDKPVVQQLAQVFAADWQDRELTARVSRLVVSPTNAWQQIARLIRGARSTLDVYAEWLNDPHSTALLEQAAQRGVRVRLVWSGIGEVSDLPRGGVRVVACKQPPITAKAMVVDGATVFVGSVNFTDASFHQNREVGVILRDRAVAAGVERAFAEDFSSGTPIELPK
ncbi:MAG TPA: phospholipase D-like domain-containing protein [Chloroflexota bacterium]|nr:phospholipase D-like domain-containing protein [Chloroflexota bacterium]